MEEFLDTKYILDDATQENCTKAARVRKNLSKAAKTTIKNQPDLEI